MLTNAPFSDARRPGRLLSLETGRGVAALMVALYHASLIVGQPRYWGTVALDGWVAEFHFAVDFFFVLSGFIITYVHWPDVGRRERLRSYAIRRFTRIYPAYWALLLPLILLYQLAPSAGDATNHDPLNAVASFFLVPYPDHPVIGAAWSLVYEVFFYVIFGLLIVLGRWFLLALAAWIVLIAHAQFTGLPGFPLSFWTDAYNLEFLFGIGTALVLRNVRVRGAGIFLALGTLGFAVCALSGFDFETIWHTAGARLIFGGFSAAIILGAVELERSGRLRVGRAMALLGSSSYAIYIAHGVAQSLTVHVLHRFAPALAIWQACIVVFVASAVAGLLFHRAVERPLTVWVRGLLQPGRRVPLAAPLAPATNAEG